MPNESAPDLGVGNALAEVERALCPEALIENKMLSFRGRIGRAVFWGRLLLGICCTFNFALLPMVIYLIPGITGEFGSGSLTPIMILFGTILTLLSIALFVFGFWLSLATHVKRWHDLDYSGWMTLLNVIPFVGFLILIWQGYFKGTDGSNRFGPDPIKWSLEFGKRGQ
jgi:uncharacterized membrane protein YhaH (DUF805 family)